jgi:hypothetical protein
MFHVPQISKFGNRSLIYVRQECVVSVANLKMEFTHDWKSPAFNTLRNGMSLAH